MALITCEPTSSSPARQSHPAEHRVDPLGQHGRQPGLPVRRVDTHRRNDVGYKPVPLNVVCYT
jgi:hypothetical protein